MLSYLTTAFFKTLRFVKNTLRKTWIRVVHSMGCQRILNSWKYRRVDFREYGDNEIRELIRLLGQANIYLVEKTLMPSLKEMYRI